MQDSSKIATSLPGDSAIHHSHVRRGRLSFWQIRLLLHHARQRCLNTLYIWSSAFRSLTGHIQIQSAKELPCVSYGQALAHSPDGHPKPNIRSLARSMYTQKLLATYPWLDIVDLRIFLMGFDAGEQWSHCSLYNETERPTASWISLVNITQEINVEIGHTSAVTPAAIAGVTRSDE